MKDRTGVSPAATRRKRSAAHPGEADEQRYRLLFEASPLPLWIYDLETLRILDVNEVACRKYGYTHDEFVAMTILDIRPPEDIALVQESVRTTPTEVFNSGIWRHRLKDGTLINVEITSHELMYMGRRTRFVCPIDVTQRVRAEAALRAREAGLKRAQAMVRLGHVVSLPGGAFESWSETLPALAGIAPEEMPRTTREWMLRVVHADDRALYRARTVEAAASGARVDLEYRIARADGGVTHIQQVIEPIAAAKDDPRWFSSLLDVTEQKLAQERVQRANEELEQRVSERTAQLEVSNRELALATAAAERASRAKSDFLSNMSHELRTPLNAIIGFGQLLAAPDNLLRSPERHAVFADHIVRAGRHLLSLINDILNLAQIEAGKLAVAVERLALTEVLADCQAMVEPLAAQRDIRVVVGNACDLAVVADRTRLKQVLLNLVSNAVKYNRERGSVIIECHRRDARVRIAVQDTGPGLRPEQLEALFQPFNRLGQESSGAEGSGIGLVVTKRLVELMAGEIGVHSTPGLGSVFWVELPAAAAVEAPVIETVAAAATATREGAPIATVLCVEDNPASLQLVQEVLATRADVQLLSASNGRLGVELARAHLPDVILMDNNMPELSGREAQAILRNDPRTAGIPIIALSGNAMPGAAEQGRAAGFFRYLTKPFDVDQLLAAVDDALTQQRSAAG